MMWKADLPGGEPRRRESDVRKKRNTRKHKEAMRRARRLQPVCALCRRRVATETHHVVPMSRGGSDRASNLLALCTQCHYEQHNPPPIDSKTGVYVRRGGAAQNRNRSTEKTKPWIL